MLLILVLVMRLGIVRRREIGCRVYIAEAGASGRWQDEELFALRRPRAGQNRGVGVFGIGVGERVGFSPRILSSRLFLPLFVLYYLIFYIKEKKTGRFKLLCEFVK